MVDDHPYRKTLGVDRTDHTFIAIRQFSPESQPTKQQPNTTRVSSSWIFLGKEMARFFNLVCWIRNLVESKCALLFSSI